MTCLNNSIRLESPEKGVHCLPPRTISIISHRDCKQLCAASNLADRAFNSFSHKWVVLSYIGGENARGLCYPCHSRNQTNPKPAWVATSTEWVKSQVNTVRLQLHQTQIASRRGCR